MSERSLFLQTPNIAKQSWMLVVVVVFMACVATTSHAWLFKSHYTSSTSNHALITRPSYTIGSSKLSMSTGNNVNMAESLQTWIYENVYNKRDDSKLQLMDSSNGVYAIAKQPIGRDDILFSTPIGYALDMTKANGIFQSAMSGITLKTKDIGMLALLLLHEKSLGKASKYHVYIESLPKVAPGILAWSATLQQQYQQSTTRQIQNINTAIATDIKYIQSNTKLLQLLTSSTSIVEDFTWAIGIVKSRAFYVDNKYVLVPGNVFLYLI